MKTLLIILIVLLILIRLLIRSKPYTHQEWEDQMASDFKKYGPLPEDIDEVKDLKKGDIVWLDGICMVTIIYCCDTWMHVAYDDMTRRSLKREKYKITSVK